VKLLLVLLLWCLLAVLCWPVAIVALLLFPVVWLVTLPFRFVFNVAEALLALIKALLFLPARILGLGRKSH
jgi:hypothetical protein